MTDDAAYFASPSVAIVLELEAMPKVVWNAATKGQSERLHDWLTANEQLSELLGRALVLSPDFLQRLDELVGE